MIGGIVVVSGLPVEVVVTKKQKYERSDTKSFKKNPFMKQNLRCGLVDKILIYFYFFIVFSKFN